MLKWYPPTHLVYALGAKYYTPKLCTSNEVNAEYPLNTCLQISITLYLNLICTIADSKLNT